MKAKVIVVIIPIITFLGTLPGAINYAQAQYPTTFYFHLTNKHFGDNVMLKVTAEDGKYNEWQTHLWLSSNIDRQVSLNIVY